MKHALLTCLLGGGVLVALGHLCAAAQFGISAKTDPTEINIVFRISRQLIDKLSTRRIQRVDPVYLEVLETPIAGYAYTDATFRIKFDESASESAFFLELMGTTRAATVSERSIVRVYGSSHMGFHVRKRVKLDGLKFQGDPTMLATRFSVAVESIETPPGLIGLIARHIAEAELRRSQPVIAEVSYEDGQAKLVEAFEKDVSKLLADLNKVNPLRETINTLFPETRDWINYLSTTPTHLIIGTGPRGRRVPELPVTDQTKAPIELWIRGKTETQGLLKISKIWKDAGQQLEALLPGELGKAVKAGEGYKTVFVKEWIVIQLGMGSGKAQPDERGPQPSAISGPLIGGGATTLPLGSGDSSLWRPASKSSSPVPGASSPGAVPDTILWRPAGGLGNPLQLPPISDSGSMTLPVAPPLPTLQPGTQLPHQ
jgi:hypothetical protein